MLPPILDYNERAREQRPSLPAIRDLFGEHLEPTKPNSTYPLPRSFPFSLADLGSSLPPDSRPHSPVQSQGWNSPKSAWSQTSSSHSSAHGRWAEFNSPRHQSDTSAYSPPISATHDQILTLPPLQRSYHSPDGGISRHTSSPWRPSLSSRRAYESHNRARSTSETIDRKVVESLSTLSKRRHTIGYADGRSPILSPFPAEPSPVDQVRSRSPSVIGSPYARRASLKSSYADAPQRSSAPSPSTSGEDAPTERRKAPAKYPCLYCGKRFNRPSSLKIHYNAHTGEKPFACPFPGCGRHFSVMSNMRRHARIHGETVTPQRSRESSVEAIPDIPSPAFSSASSTRPIPIFSKATSSSRSYTPSTSPSPHLHSLSLPSRSGSPLRNSTRRSHPYKASPPLSSDDEDANPEH